MHQVYNNLSTYSADLFGVCSALYELGGLIVMHDASGCNSTYNTHDEPRWYTMDSMVYVSGLNEQDAILGNDERLIRDICDAAEEEKPKFIALSRSVLPTYMGTDVRGIARVIEKRTGIPAIGFATNGMDSYIMGAGAAYRAIAERFCTKTKEAAGQEALRVNLIGVTPLDFSVCGNVEALSRAVAEMGFVIQSNWSMGCTLEELKTAPDADVSLVVSTTGLPAALYLERTFGVPYVIGLPVGKTAWKEIRRLLVDAAKSKQSRSLYAGVQSAAADNTSVCIVGEAVHSAALRYSLEQDCGCNRVSVLCPLEKDAGVLRPTDHRVTDEAGITAILNRADCVIADPIYRRVTDPSICFVDDPHDACSGRMYHDSGWLYIGESTGDDLSQMLCRMAEKESRVRV